MSSTVCLAYGLHYYIRITFLWLYEPLLKERAPAVISGLSNKSGSCGRGKKKMKCGKREQRTAVAGAFSDKMRMVSEALAASHARTPAGETPPPANSSAAAAYGISRSCQRLAHVSVLCNCDGDYKRRCEEITDFFGNPLWRDSCVCLSL